LPSSHRLVFHAGPNRFSGCLRTGNFRKDAAAKNPQSMQRIPSRFDIELASIEMLALDPRLACVSTTARFACYLRPIVLLAQLHEPTASNRHRKHEPDEIYTATGRVTLRKYTPSPQPRSLLRQRAGCKAKSSPRQTPAAGFSPANRKRFPRRHWPEDSFGHGAGCLRPHGGRWHGCGQAWRIILLCSGRIMADPDVTKNGALSARSFSLPHSNWLRSVSDAG
jgi:hypothetical protein